MSKNYLYRYQEQSYSIGVDQFDNPLPGYQLKIELYSYRVIRETSKGVWINDYGKDRFVLLTARKKFACRTKEEALESFIARKNRQIKILSLQLEKAKLAKKYAENKQIEKEPSYLFLALEEENNEE
jgi:hypothetical protein